MTGGCAMSRDECAAAARCDAAARRAPSGALWKPLCMSTVLFALAAIARSCLRTRRTAAACVVLLSVTAQIHCAGAQLSPRDRPPPPKPDGGVCGSVDIRNSVSEFSQLKGCRLVEGFVRILLIEAADESQYQNLEFPELTEITGYLLLYRASGLHSLAKLFPNLAVIRGNTLMLNYALISFEMMNLRELGLLSLREIVRGGVRFEKNPNLCFADTIDWDAIAPNAIGLHYIKGNREKNECPMCPTHCPRPPVATSSPLMVNQPLCWNSQHCQTLCPSACKGGCDPKGVCCHENCLGGCRESPTPSADVCTACRDVQHRSKCIKRCPEGTYQYLQRRCITEAECYAMPLPLEVNMPERNTTWKPFNMTACILDCPPGTEEKLHMNRLVCGECHGQCRKECHAHNVDSIASAQKLRGCTHINGALEIQVTGGKNVVKELEDNLSQIEEIDGYLKVVRSFPLISLGFLRSLRVIHGNTLESNRHALVVLDNQNLQELWDWDSRGKLEIRKGRLSFHFNPKLCLKQINRLNQIANLSQYTELEVAPNSNGDKVTCNLTVLNAWIKQTWPQGAIISWDKFEHYDERLLLGYVVYSIEAPYDNLTLYDGRDACGTDGWLVDDVVPGETNQILSFLKPYTQYAFYVKTYMIATEDSGAQSPIKYFMTDPGVPSGPQSLTIYANSSTELVIQWQPPLTPNGNITHYIVTYELESDDTPFLAGRDYCHDPVMPMEKKPSRTTEAPGAASTTPACACEEKGDKSIKQEEIDQKMWSIHFEDSLQNIVFIKNQQYQQRSRRQVSTMIPKNRTEPQIFELVVRTNKAVVTGLHHYSQYSVSVRACRELTAAEVRAAARGNSTDNCGPTSLDSARTLALPGADNVSHVAVRSANHSLGEVRLAWEEPSRPNGLIVAYQIECRRLDIEHHQPLPQCITRREFEGYGRSYSLRQLAPGNYSVRVRATSLAGNGNFAPVAYFQIRVDTETSAIGWILGGITAALALAVIGIGAILYVRHRYLGGGAIKLIASVNPEYMSTVYVPDEWEVPRKKVELLRELGQGSFGMVYEGVVKDLPMLSEPATRCAVKTVGEHASDRERSEFLNEASVMKAFHTHHVVQLLGVVSLGQPVLVVMELMTHGDLKTYLRSHRPDTGGDPTVLPPSLSRVLRMAAEIADGMAYLAAKKFVHRDLAARNCMVADDLTVKIGDFGMTRDIYETDYYRKGTKGLLPVRWMAPESLKDGVFTSRSDVWSYGVVLWEMATLASQPYQGLSNDQVLRYVIDGGVMERPDNCPERLSQLMERCWQHRPMERPSFLHLVSILLEDLSDPDAFRLVSFYHTPEAAELRAPTAIGPDDVDLGSDDEFPPRDPLLGEPHLGEPLLGEANGSAGPKLVGNGCTTPTSLQTTAC